MVVPEEEVFPETPALATDDHTNEVPITVLVKLINAVSPEHCGFVEFTVAVARGIGLTAIVYVPTEPGQPPTCVLAEAETIKLTVVKPLCESVNDGIELVFPERGVAPFNPFTPVILQE